MRWIMSIFWLFLLTHLFFFYDTDVLISSNRDSHTEHAVRTVVTLHSELMQCKQKHVWSALETSFSIAVACGIAAGSITPPQQ